VFDLSSTGLLLCSCTVYSNGMGCRIGWSILPTVVSSAAIGACCDQHRLLQLAWPGHDEQQNSSAFIEWLVVTGQLGGLCR